MDKNTIKEIIQEIFVSKTNNTRIQLFRYLFVGGIAFSVDFGLLYLFTSVFKLYYLLSASLSFLTGLIVNYLISTKWIFTSRRFLSRRTEFFIFAFVGLLGLLWNILFMWFFTDILKMFYLISKIISTVLVFLWNFFARKYILFNQEEEIDR